MYNFQNPYLPGGYSPFAQNMNAVQPAANPTQVVRVNGRNGAEAYAIGPNSSALLLDESGMMVWLITSDGAGYKTVSAYDITPHQTAPAPDFINLESRIRRLEDFVHEYAGDTETAAAGKPAGGEPAVNQKYDGYGARRE